MRRLLILAAIATTCLATSAQVRYAKPVTIPITLSGNVGEIRANHFHSGIDIKTGGVVGTPVLAVADGYVSRISVSPTGYGLALYITHNDGSQSVYGHLDRFDGHIAKYVKDEQYRQRSFAVDLYPPKTQLPVTSAERVAYSGNSGSSGGPHLHFEIRDAASRPLNILQMGLYDITDTKSPDLFSVILVEIDTVAGVGIHRTAGRYPVVKTGGQYTINDTVRIRKNSYFAYELLDFKDGTTNTMGIYSITQNIGDKPNFRYALDKIDFATTRYVNTLVLYNEHKRSRREVIRTYISANNKLNSYDKTINGGVIAPDDANNTVTTIIEDDNRNTSRLVFHTESDPYYISQQNDFPETIDIYGNRKIMIDSVLNKYLMPAYWNKNFNYRDTITRLTIPSGALYESALIGISVDSATKVAGSYSPVIEITSTDNPLLQNAFTLSIRDSDLPANLRPYAFIAYVNDSNKATYVGGKWDNGEVTATHRGFGRYCIAIDNTPPVIKPRAASGSDLSAAKELIFTVSDDMSGVSKYVGEIDGEWALFEYDPKNKKLSHKFDYERFGKGVLHNVTLTLTDAKGNKSTFKGQYKW